MDTPPIIDSDPWRYDGDGLWVVDDYKDPTSLSESNPHERKLIAEHWRCAWLDESNRREAQGSAIARDNPAGATKCWDDACVAIDNYAAWKTWGEAQ